VLPFSAEVAVAEREGRGSSRQNAVAGTSQATSHIGPGKTTLVEQAYAIQRKAMGAPTIGADAAVARAATSSGAPVESNVRARVESATDAELADVSVHTGADSNAAAGALGARAYTVGTQIHFADGEYAPESAAGQHLIAHELAHTVQQRGGAGAPQAKGRVSEPGDAGEVEADRVADAAMSGSRTGPIVATSAPLARAPGDGTKPAKTPSGRHETTDFGEYWVVPNTTNQPQADAQGEQLTQTAFTMLKAAWDKVKDGSGNLKITEADRVGVAHAGFKASITSKLGVLMAKPNGREIVTSLLTGGFAVTIRPTAAKLFAGGQSLRGAGAVETSPGVAGAGSSTTIEIDPACTDADVKVFNGAGAEIADPVYIFLGHEMVHARHNQLGINRSNQAAADKWGNREEEETITTGAGITENKLRAEHGLEARDGHAATDNRH
jgi:hypothetical protein